MTTEATSPVRTAVKAPQEQPSHVAAIILNWNCWEETVACVAALRDSTYPQLSIIVIDNGSSDDSERQLRVRCPDATILQSGANLGYAGGNNVGIRAAMAAGAAYVLIVNPDVRVGPEVVARLLDVAEAVPRLAALCPLVRYKADPERVWFSGSSVDWQSLRTYHCYTEHSEQFRASAWASGCCLLLCVDALRRVGLFDPRYFLYVEELDLCQRLHNRGYQVGVTGSAEVLHSVSASTGLESPRLVYYMTRNFFRFFADYGSGNGLPARQAIWRLARRYLLNRASLTKIMEGNSKARAHASGVIDALLGRSGPGPQFH